MVICLTPVVKLYVTHLTAASLSDRGFYPNCGQKSKIICKANKTTTTTKEMYYILIHTYIHTKFNNQKNRLNHEINLINQINKKGIDEKSRIFTLLPQPIHIQNKP